MKSHDSFRAAAKPDKRRGCERLSRPKWAGQADHCLRVEARIPVQKARSRVEPLTRRLISIREATERLWIFADRSRCESAKAVSSGLVARSHVALE